MSLKEITVQGTLNPDGTLQLDEKPNLSPGRVTVVLRQEAANTPPTQTLWEFMQDARRKLEEAGCHFMNEEEMQAHLDWLREPDRIDELLSESDEQRQKREQS
jgi:hypothetical protein